MQQATLSTPTSAKSADIIAGIRNRRVSTAKELLERTRAIRKRISANSGKWSAVEALRILRYAR